MAWVGKASPGCGVEGTKGMDPMSAIDIIRTNGALDVLYRLKRRIGKERAAIRRKAGQTPIGDRDTSAFYSALADGMELAASFVTDEIRKLKGRDTP